MKLRSTMATRVELAPSILDSDLANIADTLAMLQAAGVSYVHIDVMDGQFVPNISFGAPVVASIRQHTELTLDVHLMIDAPERYVDEFVEAGADILTVHPEATPHIHRVLQQIRSAGARAGISINPGTPVSVATNLLDMIELVLIMSVNPGFGGQQFIPSSLRRISELKRAIEDTNAGALIEVDGGINQSNILDVRNSGADLIVIGSAIFRTDRGAATEIQLFQDLLRSDAPDA